VSVFQSEEAATMAAERDARIATLVTMGVTRTYITENLPDREVRIEHPDLPGVLIIPIGLWLSGSFSEAAMFEYITTKLADALAREKGTPHGD
jgi:hypothetical protein